MSDKAAVKGKKESFFKKSDIATVAIPKESAVVVAKDLCDAGIKAIWNFAHTELPVPEDVVVENVHLSESLMHLSYRFKNRQSEKDRESGNE